MSFIASNNTSPADLTDEEMKTGCRLGLDTHADVSCIGRHGRILEMLEGQYSTVYPFNESYSPMQEVETVHAAFAVDTKLGPTYILKINQALNFTASMTDLLLCTNQSRANGLIIDDILPAFDRSKKSSFLIFDPDKQIRLPLQNRGPIPHLEVRYPTDDDFERCEEIELTSEFDMWDPSSEDWTSTSSLLISNEVNSELKDDFDSKILYACISSLRRESASDVNANDLSKLWNIFIRDAEMTLNSTTNNSIRLNEGRLSRRYKTEAHQRQYKQLGGYLSQFYSDTFFSGV